MSNFIKDRPDAVTIAPDDRIEFIDVSDKTESLLGTRKDTSISKLTNTGSFKSSIYSGVKSATTSIFEQSEKLASGVRALRIQNNDSTNFVYIGLGSSNSEAENNAESGTAYVNRFIVLPGSIIDIRIETETHCAWLGVGGTVSILVSQGV